MNWMNEAKKKLARCNYMRQSVINLPKEIEVLSSKRERLKSIRTNEDKGRGSQYFADQAMVSSLSEQQDLERALEDARKWLDPVERALSSLSEEEREVVERLCIKRKKGEAQRLCNDLFMSQSALYRLRQKALQKFTLAMYGALES